MRKLILSQNYTFKYSVCKGASIRLFRYNTLVYCISEAEKGQRVTIWKVEFRCLETRVSMEDPIFKSKTRPQVIAC